jgi:hypothetical protein
MYTKNEILNYLIKNAELFEVSALQLMNNKEVIQFLLLELSKCFDDLPNQYKKEELQYSKAVYRRIQGETTHEEFIKEYWGML